MSAERYRELRAEMRGRGRGRGRAFGMAIACLIDHAAAIGTYEERLATEPDVRAGPYQEYVEGCGALLARAHSQSPAAAAITGYLGKSDRFDSAVTRWAVACADQTERDHEALLTAIKSGRIAAEQGV